MRKNGIVVGAAFLAFGAFLSKLIGVFYRIPLTNIIGAEGLGLYQMVFPLYVVLLDFSALAFPSAISKTVSSISPNESAEKVLKSGLKLALLCGGVGSVLLFVFAFPVAKLQGNSLAAYGYLAISPSVILVAVISVFRGYFQGLMDMKPTAFSQVVEQAVKLAAGLVFAYIFMPDLKLALFGATFAVTISEAAALILLVVLYRKKGGVRLSNLKQGGYSRKIAALSVPVVLTGLALPLSQFADSFIIVNVLKTYLTNATELFGLLSGVALTVINLPVSVCYGFAAVSVPSVGGAKTEKEKTSNAKKTLLLTLLFTLPCALFCFFFSPFIVNLLFKSLSAANKAISVNLIKIMSPSIVFLSLLQTENSVLIGLGRPYLPLFGVVYGAVYKAVISLILLNNPLINIYGGAYAAVLCNLFAFIINLIIFFAISKNRKKIPAALSARA